MTDRLAAPRPPRRAPSVRANLAIVMVSWGIFGACWFNAVHGAPYTAFAVALGATPFALGLLSAAAVFGVVGQVVSSYLIERTGRYKLIFLAADLVQRPLWVLVGALPYIVPEPYAHWRLVGLGALTLMSSTLGSMGSPAWIGWMAHIIPGRIRARFLGARFRLATITGMITALAVGRILDWNDSFPVYFAIFGFAAAMGTIDIVLFIFVPRRFEIRPSRPTPLRTILLMPWRDRRFRSYLYYVASGYASYAIVGQFAVLYLLQRIALGTFYTNLYVMVIPLVVAGALGPTVGRQISYYGNRPVLLVASLIALPLPVMWGAAMYNNWALLCVTGAATGIVTAVLGIAELNLLFAMTPEDRRSAYLAAVAIVAGGVGAAAPIVGGLIATSLADWEITVGGFRLGNLHAVFAAATVLRVFHAAIFVPRLPEPAARSTRQMLSDIARGPMGAAGIAARRLRGR